MGACVLEGRCREDKILITWRWALVLYLGFQIKRCVPSKVRHWWTECELLPAQTVWVWARGSPHSPWAWICWFLSAFWSNLSCWWPGFGGRTRKTLQNPLLSVLALFSCSLAYLVFSLASQQATSCWIPNSPVTWEPFPWLFGRRVLSRQAVFAHHVFFFSNHMWEYLILSSGRF